MRIRAASDARVLRPRTLIALAPLLLTGGPVGAPTRPIRVEAITIGATPVTIQPDDPARTRVGALNLVAGWRLTSASSQFGGWSTLSVEGRRVTTINDGGALLRFRLGRFGHPVEARIDRLPAGCGQGIDKTTRDTESLARGVAPDHRQGGAAAPWYIGYEWRNAICRVSADFSAATALARPAAMRDWSRTKGPEAMLRLADGRWLVFAEGAPRGTDVRELLVFAGDPTDPRAQPLRVGYLPPDGYSPTDAAQLPDGRILVLNRRFALPELFTTVVVALDPRAIRPGATVEGTPIARFAPPLLSDNFEGLAVTVEHGRPFVWLISDDNQLSWEATYLLKFAIDAATRPPQAPAPRQEQDAP